MDPIEEIRARLNIEDLVSGYVQLKKAGRSLKGLCPFHSEKSPSFIVSPDKGIAYCFGCNKGGDIFRFMELIENIEFKEAVKLLAHKANVKLPAQNTQEYSKRLQIIDLNQKALHIFQDNLQANKKQLDYLYQRGLTDESIKEFRLGFALDHYHALKDELLRAGHSEEELLAAGLLNQRSMADKSSFDRFRSRIIFPILDHQGNVVAFGGRAIDGSEPKYLNSPDTPAYNKSLVLYGLSEAKEEIKGSDRAIICEGYMDVIMAHQAGTKNVVATCGTALTPQQIKLLKRFTRQLAFAFDQDEAGLEATRRAIELTKESEVSIQVVLTPLGKDPADCVKEDPKKWCEAAKNPVAVMDFYFRYARQKFDQKNLEGQKALVSFLLPLIRLFPSKFEQDQYSTRLASELKVDPKIIWQDLNRNETGKKSWRGKDQAENPAKPRLFNREEYLIGFILAYPQHYPEIIKDLMTNISFDPVTEKFYTACQEVYTMHRLLDVTKLQEGLSKEEWEKIGIYALLIEEHYHDFSEDLSIKEALKLVREINRTNLQKEQRRVQYEIRDAKESDERAKLLNQYNEILKLSSKLN